MNVLFIFMFKIRWSPLISEAFHCSGGGSENSGSRMDVEISSDGVIFYTSETEDAGGYRIEGWLCPLVYFSQGSVRQSALSSHLSSCDFTLT